MLKKLGALFSIFIVTFALTGCGPLERSGRDTAGALAGAIVQAQQTHLQECVANPALSVCQTINQAIHGHSALITALESYCGFSTSAPPPDPATAKCTPVRTAAAALQAAIANGQQLTTEVRGASGK